MQIQCPKTLNLLLFLLKMQKFFLFFCGFLLLLFHKKGSLCLNARWSHWLSVNFAGGGVDSCDDSSSHESGVVVLSS